MVVTQKVQEEVTWWNLSNIMVGRPFKMPTPTMTITDASHMGSGAHMGSLKIRSVGHSGRDETYQLAGTQNRVSSTEGIQETSSRPDGVDTN